MYSVRRDEQNRVFIDRDGTHFRYILNYLRDGAADLMCREHELRQLLREAQYYQVSKGVTRNE